MHENNNIKPSLIFSFGLVISSLILGFCFLHTRRSGTERHISVKGLSEQEVRATVGIWPIRFKLFDDKLPALNKKASQYTKDLIAFLKQKGFSENDITCGVPYLYDSGKISDPNDKHSRFRYELETTVTVCTKNVDLLEETMKKSQELLLKMNIPLVCESWRESTKFLYTELNTIKPSMLQEATINAQKAATQFASDSNVQLGALRSAIQGTFSIEDTHKPTIKRVRVVIQMVYAIQEGSA